MHQSECCLYSYTYIHILYIHILFYVNMHIREVEFLSVDEKSISDMYLFR